MMDTVSNLVTTGLPRPHANVSSAIKDSPGPFHEGMDVSADDTLDAERTHKNGLQDTASAMSSSPDTADGDVECCVICLDAITEPCTTEPCGHINFHFSCLATWLGKNPCCPLCKAHVTEVKYRTGPDPGPSAWASYVPPPQDQCAQAGEEADERGDDIAARMAEVTMMLHRVRVRQELQRLYAELVQLEYSARFVEAEISQTFTRTQTHWPAEYQGLPLPDVIQRERRLVRTLMDEEIAEWRRHQDSQQHRPCPNQRRRDRHPSAASTTSTASSSSSSSRSHRSSSRNGPAPDTPASEVLERRRRVYRNRLYSLHVGSSRASGYMDFTPEQFSQSPDLERRARAWIRRELRVFEFLSPDSPQQEPEPPSSSSMIRPIRIPPSPIVPLPLPPASPASKEEGQGQGGASSPRRRRRRNLDNAGHVLEYIIAVLKTTDVQGSQGRAQQLLGEIMGIDQARLFLHELRNFLRSPYSVEEWDLRVQYDETTNTDVARGKRRRSDTDDNGERDGGERQRLSPVRDGSRSSSREQGMRPLAGQNHDRQRLHRGAGESNVSEASGPSRPARSKVRSVG